MSAAVMRKTRIRNVHPPYRRGNAGYELVVMSAPRPLARAECDAFARALRNAVMARAYEEND